MQRNRDTGIGFERAEFEVEVRDLARQVDTYFIVRAADRDAARSAIAGLLRLVSIPNDEPHYRLSDSRGFDLLRKYTIRVFGRGLA